MAEIITLADIKEYEGASRIELSGDAIITPAARDWAQEHKICIELGNEQRGIRNLGIEKMDFLETIIKACAKEIEKSGTAVSRELLTDAIILCLERMGCKVEKCSCGYDAKLASTIEHSVIRPDASPEMVKQFCEEAVKYKFANVSLSPCYVAMAAGLLKGTGVKVCTAIAFQLGAATTKIKVAEAVEAIENGADEIDLAINAGLIKSGDLAAVKNDIEAVAAIAKGRALLKVIVETGHLTDEEKIKLGVIAKMAGADFLKVAGNPKLDDIRLMRKVVGPGMGIKADGGIKDRNAALAMIEAGADRIGASGSIKIVKY